MTFEQYAENLLEDFNTRILDENGDIYIYSPKHYDIAEIFLSYGINDDDKDFQFNIEDARNLISIPGMKLSKRINIKKKYMS